MSTMHDAFARAKAENRAALIGGLPAGYPSVQGAIDALIAMINNGVDFVEIGLPYSDPLMDGPTIQEAVTASLEAGTTIPDVMASVAAVVAATGAPVLIMSYWNPIERYGVERFANELAAAGGVGVITPDITPEEAGDWIAATDAAGIDRVFLVAPSSNDDRIDMVASVTTGFVYAASLMGVTGTRSTVSAAAEELVARTRPHTNLPIAVGLGVSTPEQAATVAQYADGVIVSSAFVRQLIDASTTEAGVAAVGDLAAALAAGVRLTGSEVPA
jgi:tryptophan synthase alpha chain